MGLAAGLFLSKADRAASTIIPSTAPTTLPTYMPIIKATALPEKTLNELVDQYRILHMIDAHNHDASGSRYLSMEGNWIQNGVDKVVLFGDVSQPSAVLTDQSAWEAYMEKPDVFIPYFSGFDLHNKSSLEVVKKNLEQGFFGLGEIAAASTYSPVVSTAAWKAKDPMDGFLPQIYALCAQYKVPILLHIDPPNGYVIDKLEEALDAYPDTMFIFAHANAFNSPENIQQLLEKHANLYADFFAGFTALNPQSSNSLADFVPVMKKFPDRFMLSTDSGYGLESEEAAIWAMYLLIDLLDDKAITAKIAHDNLFEIISQEPATVTQLKLLREQGKKNGKTYDLVNLKKIEAGRLLNKKE
jgi:hypothetical protein